MLNPKLSPSKTGRDKSSALTKTEIQSSSQDKKSVSLQLGNIIKDWELKSKQHMVLPSAVSNNLKTGDTEIFLRKDVSEDPIDLNPWCKEWSTFCLDEELIEPNIDVQHEFCIGHFTGLQSLQDPSSQSELSAADNQIKITMEDSIDFAKDDFEQPVLNIYSEVRNVSPVTLLSVQSTDIPYDLPEDIETIQPALLKPEDSSIWDINIPQNIEVMTDDVMNSSVYYKNSDEYDSVLNIRSNNTSVMFSPSLKTESDFSFGNYSTVNQMETYQTLSHSSINENAPAFIEMKSENVTVNSTFDEKSPTDLNLASENEFIYNDEFNVGVELLMQVDKSTSILNSVDDAERSTLTLKLVPDSSDCLVSTPDVIANAISLESDFNLFAYINGDLSGCVIPNSEETNSNSNQTEEIRCELSEPEIPQIQNKKSPKKHIIYRKNSTSLGIQKKKTKRGRPIKTEIIEYIEDKTELTPIKKAGESDNDFKYRQLRDKNNEASRRSRMLRKEREMQILTTLEDLEKYNQHLKNNVSQLEDECNNYRKKLLDAMKT